MGTAFTHKYMASLPVQDVSEKIRSMCCYISSNGSIANYLGVPVQMVRKIRMNLPLTVFLPEYDNAGEPIGGHGGIMDRGDAKARSDKFVKALDAFFQRRANEAGIPIEDARAIIGGGAQ